MKAVFLDRDGVINEDRDDYVKNVRELRVFPRVPELVRTLNDAGYAVFVISNQQGVAKGLIGESDLLAIQDEITRQVEAAGAQVSGFYYCTHLSSQHCSCRKPQPGMILQASQQHGIDLPSSYMVGDSEKDLVAGSAAGCTTVLVLTGFTQRGDVAGLGCQPDYLAEDLAQAVDWIVGRSSTPTR